MKNQLKTVQALLRDLEMQHRQNGKWSTASLYATVSNAITDFAHGQALNFDAFSPGLLKDFENHLRAKNHSWNTVSTYMRILRTAYKQAVVLNYASFQPYIFNKVYTGVVADRENALDIREMERLTKVCMDKGNELSPSQQQALQYFVLMFMLRGLPFVDLAYLKRNELKGHKISYRRRKTGRPLTIELTKPMMKLMKGLVNHDVSSPYLFPLLHYPDGSVEAHKEYQAQLKSFNNRLRSVGKVLKVDLNLTSYAARHTWVTIAFICGINPAVISQSVGHSSIEVTETYLKPFRQKAINDANRKVLQRILK